MTIDELIEELQHSREALGGDTEVTVDTGDDEKPNMPIDLAFGAKTVDGVEFIIAVGHPENVVDEVVDEN
jgi:hypothetical protein